MTEKQVIESTCEVGRKQGGEGELGDSLVTSSQSEAPPMLLHLVGLLDPAFYFMCGWNQKERRNGPRKNLLCSCLLFSKNDPGLARVRATLVRVTLKH